MKLSSIGYYKIFLAASCLRYTAASDVGGQAVNVASAEDVVVMGSDQLQADPANDDLFPLDASAARGGGAGLRGADLEALQTLEASLSKEMAAFKSPVEVANLPIEERATVMDQMKTKLTDATLYLKTLDWSGFSGLDSGDDKESLVRTLETTLQPMETAVDLVRQAASSGGPATIKNNGQSAKQRRRLTEENTANGKQKKQGKSNNFAHMFHSNIPKGYREMLQAANHEQLKSQHKRKRGGASLFGRHVSRRPNGGSTNSGRRLDVEDGEPKFLMCQQLAQCVDAMSIYDMFVFLKSDDIDEAAGEIDENMIVYDERDLVDKYKTTQTMAKNILQVMEGMTRGYNKNNLYGKCNNLLREFHRTVESDEVPKWEGGTITQVCYAEGSQVYVKLGDAAFGSIDTTDFRKAAEDVVKDQFGSSGTAGVWRQVTQTNRNVRQIAVTSDGKKFALHRDGNFLWHNQDNKNHPWQSSCTSCTYGHLFTTPFRRIDAASGNKIVAIDYNNQAYKFQSDYDDRKFDLVTTMNVDRVSVGRDGYIMAIDRLDGDNELCYMRGSAMDCSKANNRVCGHDFHRVFVGSKDHIYLLKTNDEMYHFRGWKNGIEGQADCSSDGTYKRVVGKARWMSVVVDDNGDEKSVYHIGTNNDVYVLRQAKDRYRDSTTTAWKKIAEGTYTSVSSNGKGKLFATKSDGSWCYWRTGSGYMDFDAWDGESTNFNGKDGWNEFYCPSRDDWKVIKVSAASDDMCVWRSKNDIRCKTVGSSNWENFLSSHDEVSAQLTGFDIGASRHNMYTVSDGARLRRRRPDGWKPITHHDVGSVKDVSVADDGQVYVVGGDWKIWSRLYSTNNAANTRYSNGLWSRIAAVDSTSFWGIATNKGFFHVTRPKNGVTLSWNQHSRPSTKKLIDVASGPDRKGSPWVVDEEMNVFRWNRYSESWVQESTDDFMFRQVSVGKEDFVVGLAENNVTRAYTGTDVHFRGLAEAYERGFETYAQETLQCAKKLFFDNGQRRNANVLGSKRFELEQFVFGENGNNPTLPCDEDGCDMSKYRIPIEVCHPDDTGCRRDEFGQVETNRNPAYNFKAYTDLVKDYRACAYALVDEFDADLTDQLQGDDVKNVQDGLEVLEQTMDDFLGDLHTSCLRTAIGDHLDTGLRLVFGHKPSPGFLCGMAEHVAVKKKKMPGYCCLDAPFELQGDAWGLPYDCSSKKCSTMGPFFSGMSTEACDVQGGTWCPYETDCSVLKDCIAEDIESSSSDFPAFSNYLKSAPQIQDHTNQDQCGRTREFFGYDEYFLNDKAICDEVYELRFSKNFNFLNDFFGGSPAGKGRAAGDSNGSYQRLVPIDGLDFDPINPPSTPAFDLGEIEYARSSEELAEKGLLWRTTNTALAQVVNTLQVSLDDTRQNNFCETLLFDGGCITPVGPSITAFAKNACEWKKQIFTKILEYVRLGASILKFASEVTYFFTMEQGNNEPWHMMDEIAAVKTNMDFTGTYMQKRFEQQNEFIADHHQKVGEALKEHQKETGEHVTTTSKVVLDAVSSVTNQVTSTVEGFVDTALGLIVEIVSNEATLKQVVLVTTFQGSLTDYSSVTIQAISGGASADSPGGSLSDLTPTHNQSLGQGKVLLTLPSTSKVVTFDITYNGEKQHKQSALISFGVCT